MPREPGILPYIYFHGIDNVLDLIAANTGEIVKPAYPAGDLWVATFRDPAGNDWMFGSEDRAEARLDDG